MVRPSCLHLPPHRECLNNSCLSDVVAGRAGPLPDSGSYTESIQAGRVWRHRKTRCVPRRSVDFELLNRIEMDKLYSQVPTLGRHAPRNATPPTGKLRPPMRIAILLVAGFLLAAGPLMCNSAWALPGKAMEPLHATPPHAHAIPGDAHGEGASVADPCDLSLTVVAPSSTLPAPRPATWTAVVAIIDPVTTSSDSWPGSPALSRVIPSTPVHQHVALLI